MATIYEVSELAKVSLATVSRVMNNSARVSDKTRRKVMDAMEQLGYQPNSIAQSLASNRTNTIGIVVPELHGPFFGTMLSGLEQELRKHDKSVLITLGHSDADKERGAIDFLISRRCDALALNVDAVPDEYLIELAEQKTPFILLNRQIPSIADRCVDLDNEYGGYLAAKAVLDAGHRSIAYIMGPQWKHDAQDRLKGHIRALKEFDIELDQSLLVEGDFQVQGGRTGMEILLDRDVEFTALVCANDEMAAGAMDFARGQGILLGPDLSVVGFDNVNISRFVYPRLTTVDYPMESIGRMAARWVLKHAYGDADVTITNLFKPTLIQRDSVLTLPIVEAVS